MRRILNRDGYGLFGSSQADAQRGADAELFSFRQVRESAFDSSFLFYASADRLATTARIDQATAFPGPDGVGDIKPPNPLAPAGVIGVGPDDAPNAIGPGVPTITVQPLGGSVPSTVGTIELNGDEDYRQVTLVAGKTYEIGMYGLTTGPNSVPLADAYIELYDAAGNFVTAADGGAMTPANEVNSGFDVLLTFTAEVSGTFYINSRAYDNDPTDGTSGEGVGDYEVFVREADPNDPGTYRPYYDLDSPLHAIDWGSRLINKIHQSARNPDGDEGTRVTGNAQGNPAPYSGPNQAPSTGNPGGFPNAPATYDDPLVDSSDAGTDPIGDPTPLTFTVPGKNVITVYYARQGELYKFDDPSQPGLTEIVPAAGLSQFEIVAMRNALASFSDVADIAYIEVEQAYVPADPVNPNLGMRAYADLTILTYNGTPGTGLLGRHSPPDEGNEGQGEYNRLGPGWDAQGLAPGGFSFVTLIHELGHGHGLAHPHDTGGGSSILRGVEEEGVAFDYTTGDFDLNQAVFTVMSYEDGWPKSPYGNASTRAGFGYQTGLSAFDIAVIQDKYGVNEEFRTGNDVYVLPEANAIATFNPDGTLATKATGYSTIWDAGGIDEIRYTGARNATIDLRAATLRYEIGGGGWMSFTTGPNPVYAGFTIANGVTIENATTGSGNDTLVGNAADNRLDGGLGNDSFDLASGGNDTLIGGGGNDAFAFGAAFTANDRVDGGSGSDQIGLQGNYAGANALTLGADTITGVEVIAVLPGFSYDLTLVDANVPAGGLLTIFAGQLAAGESLIFDGSAETDGAFRVFGGLGNDTMIGGGGDDGFYFGPGKFDGADSVNGGAGTNDQLGLDGDYTITLGSNFSNIEVIALFKGPDDDLNTYTITVTDAAVAAGRQLTIFGTLVVNAITFDGSQEINGGSFRVFGGKGNDVITGSAGNDLIYGLGGADTLTGGGGSDIFAYTEAAESTGVNFDRLVGFDHTADKIDLPFELAGFTGALTGSLSDETFDLDLSNALASQLGAGQAILFTANSGDMAGRIFGVIDANGVAGYQSGEDYVIEFIAPIAPPPIGFDIFV